MFSLSITAGWAPAPQILSDCENDDLRESNLLLPILPESSFSKKLLAASANSDILERFLVEFAKQLQIRDKHDT
jgi:hypothetical protein